MSPRPMDDYFDEGMRAREEGKRADANHYCAGSSERREWAEGFRATPEKEPDDELGLDPNEDSTVRPSGL